VKRITEKENKNKHAYKKKKQIALAEKFTKKSDIRNWNYRFK
jgi:hypothetical protein